MTLVTTSRKPIPQLRTLAKDLAFTLGGRYMPRGKAGISEILEHDTIVVIVSQKGRHFLLGVFKEGEDVAEVAFSSIDVRYREDQLIRGLQIENQTVYESLGRYLDVLPADLGTSTMVFDGAQRRRYVLTLVT